MDHSHGDMDHSGSMGAATKPACEMSMLMNWKTINTCFISREWQNLSGGMYAGSVIGVFVLVIAIEAVRRMKREYDRKLLRDKAECGNVLPSWPQQVVRAFLYGGQFTAAFFVMLLGMYFNAPILIAIFVGQTVGFVLFGRDTASIQR